MRIGRDHIASTIDTIVFAYAGAVLSVLLLIFLYERPAAGPAGTEHITTDGRSLASATGLVLTVPVTTAIAATDGRGRPPAGARAGRSSSRRCRGGLRQPRHDW